MTRGTTSVYHPLTEMTLQSVKQHPCSVTGTPDASYTSEIGLQRIAHEMNSLPYSVTVFHQPTAL